jgi:hypothetical protein
MTTSAAKMHYRITARPVLTSMKNTKPGGWFRNLHANINIINGVSRQLARG